MLREEGRADVCSLENLSLWDFSKICLMFTVLVNMLLPQAKICMFLLVKSLFFDIKILYVGTQILFDFKNVLSATDRGNHCNYTDVLYFLLHKQKMELVKLFFVI